MVVFQKTNFLFFPQKSDVNWHAIHGWNALDELFLNIYCNLLHVHSIPRYTRTRLLPGITSIMRDDAKCYIYSDSP